jgi:hypothetical protein
MIIINKVFINNSIAPTLQDSLGFSFSIGVSSSRNPKFFQFKLSSEAVSIPCGCGIS